MSWAGEEWKEGLSHKVLDKFNQIEQQNEKLKKETKQKQLQIESLDAAFNKQKKKIDDEKSEITLLKRENNSIAESCVKLEQKIDKLVCDIRHKDSHITSLESQLQRYQRQNDVSSNKVVKQDPTLDQELKHLQNKVKEFEDLFEKERRKCVALQKNLTELKQSKPMKKSYVPSMPWATDDVVSTPSKKTVVDLLTGSPISSTGSGDALIPISQPTSQAEPSLKQALEDSKKRVKELELELEDRIKQPKYDVQNENMKVAEDKTKFQIQLDEANYQVAEYKKKIFQVSEELKCERLNAESTKAALQSKFLKSEKAWKQENIEANNFIKSLEKQIHDKEMSIKKEISSVKTELNESCIELERKISIENKLETEIKKLQQKLFQMEQIHQSDENKIKNFEKNIKELQRTNDQTTASLERVNNKNVLIEKELVLVKQNLSSFQSKLNDANSLLNLKVGEIEALKKSSQQRISQIENQSENLRLRLSEADNKISKAENLIKQKEMECSTLTNQLERLKSNFTEKQLKLEKEGKHSIELAKENNMLIEQNESTVLQLKKVKQEVEKLKELYDKDIRESERKLQQLKQCSQKEQEAMKIIHQQQLDEIGGKYQEETEELRKKINFQDESIQKLGSRMKEEEEQLIQSEDELKKLEGLLKDAEGKNLKLVTELKEIRLKEEEVSSTLSKIQEKMEVAERDAATSMEEYKILEEKHKSLVVASRDDAIERRCLEGRVQDLEHQVSRMKEEEDEDARRMLHESQEEAKKLSHVIDNCEAVKHEKMLQVERLESELAEMQESLRDVEDAKQEVMRRWNDETSAMKSKIEVLEQELNKNQKQVDDFGAEKQLLVQKMEQSDEECCRMSELCRELEEKKQSLVKKLENMQKIVRDKDEKLASVESMFVGYEENLDKLVTELSTKEDEVKRCRCQIDEMQDEFEDVSCKLTSSHEHITNLNNIVEDMEEKLDRIMTEKSQLEMDIENSCEKSELERERFDAMSKNHQKETQKIVDENQKLKLEMSENSESLEELRFLNNQQATKIKALEEDFVAVKQNQERKSSEYDLLATELKENIEKREGDVIRMEEVVESLKLEKEKIISEKLISDELLQKRLEFAEEKEEECKKMRQEFEENIAVCQEVKDKLLVAENKLKKFEEKNEVLLQTISQKENLIDNYGTEFESLENNFATKLEHLTKEHTEVKEKLKDNIEKLNKSEDKVVGLKREKEKLDVELETCRLEIEKLNGQFEILQMDSEDKDEIIKKFETVLIPNLQTQLEEVESINNDFVTRLSLLEEQKIAAEERLNLVQVESEKSLDEISMRDRQLENSNIEQNTLKNKLQEVEEINAHLCSELERLETSFNDEKSSCVCLMERNKCLEEQLSESKNIRKQQEDKIVKLKEEIEEMLEKQEKLNEENGGMKMKLEALQAVMDEERELNQGLREAIEKQNFVHSADVEGLNDEITQLESELESVKQENMTLECEKDEMYSRLENQGLLCCKFEDENLALRNDNNALHEELATKTEKLSQADRELTSVNEDLEKLNTSFEQKLLKEKAGFDVLRTQLDAKTHELDEAVDKLAENELEINDMKISIKRQTEMFDGLKKIHENVIEQKNSVESIVGTLTNDLAKLQSGIETMEEKLNDSEKLVTEMKMEQENQTQFINAKLLASENELVEVKNNCKDLIFQLNERNDEVAELRRSLEDLTTKSVYLHDQCDQLKKDKKNMEESLSINKKKFEDAMKHEDQLNVELIQVTKKLDEVLQTSNTMITSLNQQLNTARGETAAMTTETARLGDLLQSRALELEEREKLLKNLKADADHLLNLNEKLASEQDHLKCELENQKHKNEKMLGEKEIEYKSLQENSEKKLQTIKDESAVIINDLKNKVQNLKGENHVLEESAESEKKLLKNLSKDLEESQRANLKFEEKILWLETQKEDLVKKVEVSSKNISNLQSTIDEQQIENDSLKQHIGDLMQSLSGKESIVDQLIKSHEQFKLESKVEVEALQQKVSELSVNLDVRDGDVDVLNEELQRLNEDVADKIRMLQHLQEENRSKEEDLNKCERKLDDADAEMGMLKKEVETLESTRIKMSNDLNRLEKIFKEKIEEMKKQLLLKEVEAEEQLLKMENLQLKLKEANTNCLSMESCLDSTINDKEVSLKQNKEIIVNLKTDIDELKEELDEKMQEISSLKCELAEITKLHDADAMLMEQKKREDEEQKMKWKQENEELLTNIEKLTADKAEFVQISENTKQKLAESCDEIKSLNDKVRSMTRSLDAAHSDKILIENDLEKREDEVHLLEDEVKKLKSDIQTKISANEILESKLGESKMDLKNVCEELDDVRRKIELMENIHREQEERHQKLMEEYSNVEKERFKLQLKLNDVELSKDGLQCTLTSSQQKNEISVSSLQQQISEMEESTKLLETNYKHNVQEKEKIIFDLCDLESNLRNEITSLQSQLKYNEDVSADLKELICHLEEKLEKTRSQYEARSVEIDDRKMKSTCDDLLIADLKSEIESKISIINHLDAQVAELRNSQNDEKLLDKITHLENELSKVSGELRSKTNFVEDLQIFVTTKDTKISELVGINEELLVKVDLNNNKLDKILQENQKLTSENEEYQRKTEDQRNEEESLRVKLEEGMKMLEESNHHHLIEMESANRDKLKCRNQLNEVSHKLTEARKDLESLQTLHDDVSTKYVDVEKKLVQARTRIGEYQEAQRGYIDAASLAEKQTSQVRHELELELKEKNEQMAKIQKIVEARESVLQQEVCRVEKLRLENQKLKLDVESFEARLIVFDESKSAKEERILELGEELDKLKTSKQFVCEENVELKKQVCNLKTELKTSNEEMDKFGKMNKENKQLTQKLVLLQSEFEQLREELDEKISRCNGAENQIHELEERLESNLKQTDYLSEETQAVSLKYEDLKTLHENLEEERMRVFDEIQVLEEEKKDLEEEVSQLKQEIKILEEGISHRDEQNSQLRKELAIMENVVAEAETTNGHMTKQLKHLDDIIAHEASEHKKKVLDCEADNEVLLQEKQHLMQENENLKIKQRLLDNDVKFRDQKMIEFEEQALDLNERLIDAENANDCWKEKFVSLKSENVTMESTLADSRSQLTKQIEYCQELESLCTETKHEVENLHDAVESLQQRLHEESEKVTEAEQNAAEAKIKFMEEKKQIHDEFEEKLSATIKTREEIEQKFSNKMKEMENQAEKITNQFKNLNDEILRLENSEKHLKNENEELREGQIIDNNLAKSKLESLLSDVEQLKLNIEKSEKEKQTLQNQVEELKFDENNNNSHLQELESNNFQLSKQIDQMKAKLRLMTNNARRNEKELHRLKGKLQEVENVKEEKIETSSSTGNSTSTKSVEIKTRRRSSRISSRKQTKPPGSPPKKIKQTDEDSSSPAISVEGLPHLVKQGFTNIPVGFSSPFVMRRQQLNQTSRLVASAMSMKLGENSQTMKLRSHKHMSPLSSLTNSPKLSRAPSGEENPECKMQ